VPDIKHSWPRYDKIEAEGTSGGQERSLLRRRKELEMALVIVIGLVVGLALGIMLIIAFPGGAR
jgi:hypothetical protein